MSLRLRCRCCGKIILPGPQDWGHLIVCSACGSRLGVLEGPPGKELFQTPQELAELVPQPSHMPSQTSKGPAGCDLPPARPGSLNRPYALRLTLVACAALAVVAVAGLWLAARLGEASDTISSPVPTAHDPPAVEAQPAAQAPVPVQTTVPDPLPAVARVVERPPEPRVAPRPPPPPVVQPPSRPARPPARKLAVPEDGVSDEQIGRAVERGVEFLLSCFEDNRLRHGRNNNQSYYAGLNALAVYALLQSGQAIYDERLNPRGRHMGALMDTMRDMPISGSHETYGRAIRATALALYYRPEDRATVQADVQWLIQASRGGAYTYSQPAGSGPRTWDNSNSQYGLLGVWSGAEVGIEVPRTYWAQVQNHWYETQAGNGQWGYRQPSGSNGTLSMTVAGIASLFVTHDYLEAPQFGSRVGRPPFSEPLARALAWLESGDNVLRTHGWVGYTLYGIERVGLASGFKYFGQHDWYRALAADLVGVQAPDGSWGGRSASMSDRIVETSYALLVLARGRHPILLNKLRFDGHWANRPRDAANLARFASRELERPLNFQVVPLSRPWTDWSDSPIVYLASHEPIPLSEDDRVKLRQFVDSGGILFTQSDGNSAAFSRFAETLARQLFAQELRVLPPDHELYRVNFRIDPRPIVRYVSNGSRLLMIHSDVDLAADWQMRAERSKRASFELGVNMFIYAAGKADFRNRLSSTYLPEPPSSSYRVRIARVYYGGNWDPEPYAWQRFARWFGYQTGYGLDIARIAPADLRAELYPLAHLTGTAAWTPTAAEGAALRRYVQEGGVLLIDACGGAVEFRNSIENELLAGAFDAPRLVVVSADHPLLAGSADGMDRLTQALLRPYARQQLGRDAGQIRMCTLGRGAIIYSPLDLTSGLLGTNTWGILGLRPDYAQSLAKNAVLWSLDREAK
jgi:hypothetical protein